MPDLARITNPQKIKDPGRDARQKMDEHMSAAGIIISVGFGLGLVLGASILLVL